MKVAVISDIHGNYQALERVLEDIEKEKCEKILCLGDLAMAGPQPDVVVSYIMDYTFDKWEIIQGNTDKMIGTCTTEMYDALSKKFPVMANALIDDRDILTPEQRYYLRTLPPRKELFLGGVSILMVHGSPRRQNEDILPNMKLSEVQEMCEGEIADLILCGHTHIPCGYQLLTKQTVVNVGSVGRPMTGVPKANYAVFDFNDGAFTVEHKAVDYDYETAAMLMQNRGFEGCETIANQLIHPTVRHF